MPYYKIKEVLTMSEETLKPFHQLTDREKEERCPRCNHCVHTDFDPTVCSFCAHSDKEDGYILIAGPFVNICNVCIHQAQKELEKINHAKNS